MPHRNRQRPQPLTSNTTEQLFEYLDRFESYFLYLKANLGRIESKIEGSQRFAYSVAKTEIGMELQQMADFSTLAAEVSKIKGTVASTKAFVQGLKAKLDEAAAGMNDTEDQAAIAALSAELSGAETELAAAIAANPEPPTGSTGGVSGSTGGV